VWWQGLRQFDLDGVRVALGQHCMNPDSGQFPPKIADVVKMMGGSSLDSALVAWSKVETKPLLAALAPTGPSLSTIQSSTGLWMTWAGGRTCAAPSSVTWRSSRTSSATGIAAIVCAAPCRPTPAGWWALRRGTTARAGSL
jgi:hypothetical protein